MNAELAVIARAHRRPDARPGDKLMAISPAERTGRLEERVDRLEEGVSNFRNFQVEAREFFVETRTQRKSEMDFHNQRDREIKDALAMANQHLNRWMVAIAALSLIAAIFAIFHR